MDQRLNNELLPNRLNGEPSIYRGCALSELMTLAALGAAVWIPFWLIVCALWGVVMMGVGLGLLSTIGWVVVGSTVLQRMKRDRPIAYYALALRLWLADKHLCQAPFVREGRVWSVGRVRAVRCPR